MMNALYPVGAIHESPADESQVCLVYARPYKKKLSSTTPRRDNEPSHYSGRSKPLPYGEMNRFDNVGATINQASLAVVRTKRKFW